MKHLLVAFALLASCSTAKPSHKTWLTEVEPLKAEARNNLAEAAKANQLPAELLSSAAQEKFVECASERIASLLSAICDDLDANISYTENLQTKCQSNPMLSALALNAGVSHINGRCAATLTEAKP